MSARRLALAAALAVFGAATAAEERIADLRQGTNLSVAAVPDGSQLVVGLAGQLWTLPAGGGGAMPITGPEALAANPRVSADGRHIVYQRRAGEQWDLWLLDRTTGASEPLLATEADEREPEWSADGSLVVFASNRTGHYCLWSVSIRDRVETQLTEEPGDASFPGVSTRGEVAYVVDRDGASTLRVLRADGSATTLYSSPYRLSAPSWRPEGGVLVFGEQASPTANRLLMLVLGEPRVLKPLTGDEDLFAARAAWLSRSEFVYGADGQLWRRALAGQARQPVHLFAAVAVEAEAPPVDVPALDEPGKRVARGLAGRVVSADGRRAAFTALGDLWLAERGSVRRLTDDAFVELDPVFWPDGDSLVFASERTGQFELWRIVLRDGRTTQLTFGASGPHDPAVRPDGKAIAFLETDGTPAGRARLRVLDSSSGETTTLATGLVAAGPPEWSDDGKTLRLHAESAGPLGRANGSVHVELVRELTPPPPAAADAPSPDVEWSPPAPPQDYVVEVGRLFDGVRAGYRRHVDLHVRGGRIVAIAARGTLPNEGPVIDARDATVIPGLIDVHTHESSLMGERLGRAWLAYGVTTVREVASDVPAALGRAETWASGRAPGPHLIVSAAEGAHGAEDGLARRYPGIASGFGHTLVQQARALGVPRFVDASASGWRPTAGSEALSVSPGFKAYQDTLSRLIAADTTFPPGLGALAGLAGWPGGGASPVRRDPAFRLLFTPAEQAFWERSAMAPQAEPVLGETVARLVRAGGHVAVGSDAPAVPYGLGVHLELALLVAAGIAPDHALRLATAEGALALGIERDVGTLEEGKLADFVVLTGDPLERIDDTLTIKAVVKGGEWRDRTALTASP